MRYEAEILFTDISLVKSAITKLREGGFDVEVMDWVDEGGTSYVWVIASCTVEHITALSPADARPPEEGELTSDVRTIVKPLSGHVDPAGLGSMPIKEAVAEHNQGIPRTPGFAELERDAAVERALAGIDPPGRVLPAIRATLQ